MPMSAENKGFTLIEVLVAMMITAIVLTSIYGIFSGISSARERIESDGGAYHQARVLFARLGREIRSTYAGGGGIFIGGRDEDDRPFLEMTTTVSSPVGGTVTGLARVRYELRDDPEDIGGPDVLMRRETSPLHIERGEAAEYRLAGDILGLGFRFYDGREWRDEWNAGNLNALPRMIEISLVLAADDRELPFRTAVEMLR